MGSEYLNIGGVTFNKSEVASVDRTQNGMVNTVTMRDGSILQFRDQSCYGIKGGSVSLTNWESDARGHKTLTVSNASISQIKGTDSTDTIVLDNSSSYRLNVSGDKGNSDTVILKNNGKIHCEPNLDSDDHVLNIVS